MDYEKMYKAVLKTAEQWVKDGCSDKERICLESVFPELRESEDERIRKAIIHHILYEAKGVSEEQEHAWITYLEKQKEQKPEIRVKIPKFRVGDIIQHIPLEKWDSSRKIVSIDEHGYNVNLSHLGDTVSGGAIGFAFENEYELVEQKPAQWSEEDEKIRGNLMSLLANMRGDRITEETYQKYYPWLKSLRPQPKQNVNDMITPNKEFFQWIYDRLVNVHKENPNVDYMLSFKRRIEELSFDEPHWKPSEEQIEVDLDELINDFLLNNSEFLVERDSKAVVQKLARHFYELARQKYEK